MLHKPPKEVWEQLVLTMQVGLTFAGSLLFCFAVGYWLDQWLGASGVILTIFILLGVAGGGYTVYRQIMEQLPPRDQDRDEPE
jgi:ATP synthase protein I